MTTQTNRQLPICPATEVNGCKVNFTASPFHNYADEISESKRALISLAFGLPEHVPSLANQTAQEVEAYAEPEEELLSDSDGEEEYQYLHPEPEPETEDESDQGTPEEAMDGEGNFDSYASLEQTMSIDEELADDSVDDSLQMEVSSLPTVSQCPALPSASHEVDECAAPHQPTRFGSQ